MKVPLLNNAPSNFCFRFFSAGGGVSTGGVSGSSENSIVFLLMNWVCWVADSLATKRGAARNAVAGIATIAKIARTRRNCIIAIPNRCQ